MVKLEKQITSLEEYLQHVNRTYKALSEGEEDLSKDFAHCDYGVFTEMHEIFDIFKKKLAYNKEIDVFHLKEELGDVMFYLVKSFSLFDKLDNLNSAIDEFFKNKDRQVQDKDFYVYKYTPINFAEGVSQWGYNAVIYLCLDIMSSFNLELYDVLTTNINKLMVRYPEKFTEEKALNRNLNKEKQALN